MLTQLTIQNFAIIDRMTIPFNKGFHVITGETGSGKSILLHALSILLGARATKDLIKNTEKPAQLEAVFFIDNPSLQIVIESICGEILEEDGILILSKEIRSEGPNFSKVNGHSISLSQLKKLSSALVDIYGQFDYQVLLNRENHLFLIDSMGDEDFQKLKGSFSSEYHNLKTLESKLSEGAKDKKELEKEADYLSFQIQEIENLDLKPEEDILLEQEFHLLKNFQQVFWELRSIIDVLDGNTDKSSGLVQDLLKCSSSMSFVSNLDPSFQDLKERLESLYFETTDIKEELSKKLSKLFFDDERYVDVEQRLNSINTLKLKYGMNVDGILSHLEDLKKKYDDLMNRDFQLEIWRQEYEKAYHSVQMQAEILSSYRKQYAETLKVQLLRELTQLNMKNTDFQVRFIEKELSSEGLDDVEFLISTNVGEPLKPLVKIVSGGEVSRITLALKSIFSEMAPVPTLIFDEIDTGISGVTAQILAEKILRLSKGKQVICISHLPQIASIADHHYLIQKETDGEKTYTSIALLSHSERVYETAKLFGGIHVTEANLRSAKEMIERRKGGLEI